MDGSGNWLVSDDSSPTFTISAGTLPTPTVTQPATAGPFSQSSMVYGGLDGGLARPPPATSTSTPTDGTYYLANQPGGHRSGLLHLRLDRRRHPVDTGYVIRVWYMDAGGNWLFYDDSSPTFAIQTGTLPFPTVTAPSTAGPFTTGSRVPVSFDVAYPSTTGSFHVYALRAAPTTGHQPGGRRCELLHLRLDRDSAHRLRVRDPGLVRGRRRQLAVLRRLQPGLRDQRQHPPPSPPSPCPTRPDPSAKAAWCRWPGRWPTPPPPGTFHVYAFKDGTYHWLNSQEATGAGSYTYDWTVTQPVDTGYVVRVWYVDAAGNWLVFDDSSPSFAIKPVPCPSPPSPCPTRPAPSAKAAWCRWPSRWPMPPPPARSTSTPSKAAPTTG